MSHSHLNTLCCDFPGSMEFEIGVTHSDLALVESWFQSDASTGYLEDAIAGRGIQCKEQKLPSCSMDQKVGSFPSCSTTIPPLHDSVAIKVYKSWDYCFTHHKKLITRNLSSSQSDAHNDAAIKHDPAQRSCATSHCKKIAYPFKLVKPGGVEGETTLKDINHQILMTPSTSRPIPHPVEDSVTHSCILARGFGMSGKAVVSITKIQTQGRGSITIIRTKD